MRGVACPHFFLRLINTVGSERGEPKTGAVRSGAPQKALPIETPVLSLSVLNRLTDNSGTIALIGEGAYGRFSVQN